MRHHLLDPHDTIAWDMDETLVNGDNSEFFRRYIKRNPHKKNYVVTFRTPHSWAMQIYGELEAHGLDRSLFLHVVSVPQRLWEAYALRASFYQPNLVEEFYHWKGKAAAELGCTVLIDDMEDLVIRGCDVHDVTFIHSHDRAFRI